MHIIILLYMYPCLLVAENDIGKHMIGFSNLFNMAISNITCLMQDLEKAIKILQSKNRCVWEQGGTVARSPSLRA